MALSVVEKQAVVTEYGQNDKDTGSVESQVALLTTDINKLTDHFKTNKHDFHSRRGLMFKVSQRRKLLKYLRRQDVTRYRDLMKRLSLREAQAS